MKVRMHSSLWFSAPESLKTDPFEHGLLQRFLKYPTRDRLKFHKDTVLRLLSALSFQGTHSCDSPQTPTSSLSIHQNTSTPPKMSMHFHGVSSSETPVVDESVGFKILHKWLISWRWWWFSHTRFEPGSVSMFCLQMCQLQMCCSEWCTSMAQRQYLTLTSHYWSSCILFWQWKISQISFAPMRILQMIL